MKVIHNKYKPPKAVVESWPKKVYCDICKSLLEIDKDDRQSVIAEIDGMQSYWINCPACGKYSTYTEQKSRKT